METDTLLEKILRCGRGFRSVSFHSDGRWIVKSGKSSILAGKMFAATDPVTAVDKLLHELEVTKYMPPEETNSKI